MILTSWRPAFLAATLFASTIAHSNAADAPPPTAASDQPLPALPRDVAGLVQHVLRDESFVDVALSPTGEFFAATVRRDGRTGLVLGRVADPTFLSTLAGGTDSHVSGFWWVNDTEVVASMGESFGQLEAPRDFGELWILRAKEGAVPRFLAGWRGAERTTGTRVVRNQDHTNVVLISDPLRNDDENILVSVQSALQGGEGYSTAELLELDSGRRKVVARAPVRRASYVADHAGEVRFAYGAGADNHLRTYYREGQGKDWVLVNDEGTTGFRMIPIGFRADDAIAYVQVEHAAGPDSIDAFDPATLERTPVLRHERVDPGRILVDPATGSPIGAVFMDGLPQSRFFDPDSPAARTQRSLEAAFPGQAVNLRSTTKDGGQQLVIVSSDRNPGDYYHFDRATRSATLWASRSRWIDPEQMAAMKPIQLNARDGLALHGYLTVAPGLEASGLPMVVLPHGGPFGVRDSWGYDPEVQLLAARGFAVLQVNFRGSGGYGKAFVEAGARQWGQAMQDDLTDATRWAIEQGIADPSRICIYGSSYGGYAALMGAAKEPALYRCAAGNVGVYDLEMMFGRGDVQRLRSGENFLETWIGTENLEQHSPVNLADRIRVPVFLAAGAEDERAPPEHTRAMAAALERAGRPAELKIYEREGHGYYLLDNRRDYYRRLLGFLEEQIGAAGGGDKAGGG